MKTWQITHDSGVSRDIDEDAILDILLRDRGVSTKKQQQAFLQPVSPMELTPADVDMDAPTLRRVVSRIKKAIDAKESIVVYADYDADGITAGAVMWETLWKLGARVMPYIPHREGEGYGLSEKGVDTVREQYDPTLIITVDHGITARDKVSYARSLGIEVIVTDHHVKPKKIPDCLVAHTTSLAGSGVSWFVARQVAAGYEQSPVWMEDRLALAALGTIADLVPLVGANRSIASYGLRMMKKTRRVGLNALLTDAGVAKDAIDTYTVSHMLAPRLNAMGRIEHALDALRLLCTTDSEKANVLAQKLGLTNKTRQQMTEESVLHAHGLLPKSKEDMKKLIFIAHESYNQGIIGLVAGKLTEEYYRPSIVVSVGKEFSKASARSIPGFNIIEAIRSCSELLVDAGGHPMAAGFTVETKQIEALRQKLEGVAESQLQDELLARVLHIDMVLSLPRVTVSLWKKIQSFMPFGVGNPQPVFATRGVSVADVRLIGATRKHIKCKVRGKGSRDWLDVIAFNMADRYGMMTTSKPIDIAYTIDMNEWNGKRNLQLKARDIILSENSS